MEKVPFTEPNTEQKVGSSTEAVEDYAKAIYKLQRREDGPVANSTLVEVLRVSPGAVTAMLKRMDEMGLVSHAPYKGATLTPAGERLAIEVIRHHRLLEAYLSEALGMPWDKVHDEAEVLEHYISEDLEELIAAALGHPSHDPHGDPIPNSELELAEQATTALSQLERGDAAIFVRVSDADPEMLRYLADRELAPGDRLEVIERQPFGGPLSVRFAAGEFAIGGGLADAMRVLMVDPQGER
jgi:DtxR family Mn-dependent transcriptional regulator